MASIQPYDTTLGNGLRLIVCPDHAAPVVNVTVMYRVGSHDERRGKTGLAHLFEHLMFDNAAPDNDKQYDVYCTKAGGSNNAYTTFDYTTYHIDLPSNNVELGFWLESERMKSFRITQHALQTQRSVVVEEINQNVTNQPYGVWRRAQQEVAFTPASSYSWDVYGYEQDVSGVSIDDAKSFFQNFYRPSNAVLCVSGDVTADKAVELAQRFFGDIPDSKEAIVRNSFDSSFRNKGVHSVVQDKVPMTAVFMAAHVPGFLNSELLDIEIAATIIGSGKSSLLHQSLVEDKRIATMAGAYLDRRAHSSLLTMYAYAADPSITGDQLAEAITGALCDADMTKKHVDAGINKIRSYHASELQKVNGVSDVVAWTTLFYNDPTRMNTILDDYRAVGIDQIMELRKTCCDVDSLIRLDVVPKG
ncbi:MAG: insulinase family protein [Candidatus Kapabacteria bacterium]|nr:insulinase family protein [Candidatus Kapabacteria bacterium]